MTAWTTPTATGVRNVHSRVTDGTVADAAALIEALGTRDDRLWPRDRWPRIRLDQGTAEGSRGGNAGLRYRVLQVEPGRRVRFVFESGSHPAVTGWHELRVDPIGDDGLQWTHELVLEHPSLQVRTGLIPLHDALLEDLFDQIEYELGQHPLERPEFSASIRTLRALMRPAKHKAPVAATPS